MYTKSAIFGAILSLSATVSYSDPVPEEFFSFNDPIQAEIEAGKRIKNLPLFPILGSAAAPVKIDYFYSASCEPCKKASNSIFRALSDDVPIQVSFHPIPANQEDYDAAIAETILYTTGQLAFGMFHFANMDQSGDDTIDAKTLFRDVSILADVRESASIRMDNYRDWTTNISVSSMIAENIGVVSLPTIVMGDRKYEGFLDHESFLKEVQQMIDRDD